MKLFSQMTPVETQSCKLNWFWLVWELYAVLGGDVGIIFGFCGHYMLRWGDVGIMFCFYGIYMLLLLVVVVVLCVCVCVCVCV